MEVDREDSAVRHWNESEGMVAEGSPGSGDMRRWEDTVDGALLSGEDKRRWEEERRRWNESDEDFRRTRYGDNGGVVECPLNSEDGTLAYWYELDDGNDMVDMTYDKDGNVINCSDPLYLINELREELDAAKVEIARLTAITGRMA